MILKALTLGFSTGVFCLGACYPILAPVMLSREESGLKQTGLSLGLFMLGRLVAYALFGALIGLLGQHLGNIPWIQSRLLPGLFILLGVLMILYGIIQSFPRWSLCHLAGRYAKDQKFLLLLGFLAGINLCPPFLLALSYAFNLGTPLKGLIFFIFFFLATSVFMLPFLFFGLISRFQLVRSAARITAVIAGCWFIFLAVHVFVKYS